MFSWAHALPSPNLRRGEPYLFGWFIFPDRSGSQPKPDMREASRFSCLLFLSACGF